MYYMFVLINKKYISMYIMVQFLITLLCIYFKIIFNMFKVFPPLSTTNVKFLEKIIKPVD